MPRTQSEIQTLKMMTSIIMIIIHLSHIHRKKKKKKIESMIVLVHWCLFVVI